MALLPPRETSSRFFDDRIPANIKIPFTPPSSDFPSDVLKYMKANALPRQALKLMKVNKFFLHRKFPFNYLANIYGTGGYNSSVTTTWSYHQKTDGKFIAIDECSTLEIPGDLCIGGTLILQAFYGNILPELMPKLVACDLEKLHIRDQDVTCDQLKFLTSSGKLKTLEISGRATIYFNLSFRHKMAPEYFLRIVPHIQELRIDNLSTVSQRFVEWIHQSKLKILSLGQFHESFDFEAFLTAMKKQPDLSITLCFGDYNAVNGKIYTYVKKLLAAGSLDSYPPIMEFIYGYFDHDELKKLRSAYREQHPEINKDDEDYAFFFIDD